MGTWLEGEGEKKKGGYWGQDIIYERIIFKDEINSPPPTKKKVKISQYKEQKQHLAGLKEIPIP